MFSVPMVIALCVPGLREHFVLTENSVHREEINVLVIGEES